MVNHPKTQGSQLQNAPHFQAQNIATAKDVDALAALVVPHTDLENASPEVPG